jgi:hypothetical protein
MDESRRGTLAEATDVIGSQSRQEAAGIKHNRYAFAQATPCAMQISRFRTALIARRIATNASANRRLVTKT